ncbi:MAG: ABC transporter substrate-binding protein [Spirochaetes bacterium]|nr:MAG: ABC transporter substrate-binding protein [Spirochaetota bacterium]
MSRKIFKNHRLLFILVIILFTLSGSINILTANGVQEKKEEIEITVAVFKGPSGIAATKLLGDNFQPGFNTKVNYIILGSPMEAVAKMTSGEVDAVFLPVNMAAKLYTKGPRFKLAAVSGLGSLYMVSTDNSIKNWFDLRGKTIYLTGKGATPDYLLRYLLLENGLNPAEDVKLDFSAQAPQIAQLMIAGRAETSFIPQPFVLQIETNSNVAKTVLDPQKELLRIRGGKQAFPFTAFAISPKLYENRPEAAASLIEALEKSITWTLENPKEASQIIENYGIMSAVIAKKAIPVSGIEFVSAAEAKESVEDFLKMMLDLDPVSVGGNLPDEGFYFSK